MPEDLVVNDDVTIPSEELEYTASRASGPGGQHVNTTDSRIQVRWVPAESRALNDRQRELVLRRLGPRLSATGILVLASDAHRSQRRNRQEVNERLIAIMREALIPPRPRKKTKPSRAAKEKRLDEKKRRSQVKKGRGTPQDD